MSEVDITAIRGLLVTWTSDDTFDHWGGTIEELCDEVERLRARLTPPKIQINIEQQRPGMQIVALPCPRCGYRR